MSIHGVSSSLFYLAATYVPMGVLSRMPRLRIRQKPEPIEQKVRAVGEDDTGNNLDVRV